MRQQPWVVLVLVSVLALTAELTVTWSVEASDWSQTEFLVSPAAAQGEAALTVEGEVRTLDSSGAPRLWGRGRPGTGVYTRPSGLGGVCRNDGVKLGLSGIAVDWGSAADACPAGYWVCTLEERGFDSCDTDRIDNTYEDWWTCNGQGIDEGANRHPGWLADALVSSQDIYGFFCDEVGVCGGIPPCTTLPVWCCWE